MSADGAPLEAPALIVVRAGAIDRFAALRGAFAPEGVDVVWDRRSAERRRLSAEASSVDRRRGDRRGSAPASWTLLDFLVVPTGLPAS